MNRAGMLPLLITGLLCASGRPNELFYIYLNEERFSVEFVHDQASPTAAIVAIELTKEQWGRFELHKDGQWFTAPDNNEKAPIKGNNIIQPLNEIVELARIQKKHLEDLKDY